MRKTKLVLLACVIGAAALLTAGCSLGGESGQGEMRSEAAAKGIPSAVRDAASGPPAATLAGNPSKQTVSPQEPAPGGPAENTAGVDDSSIERKRIKTGSTSIEVADLAKAERETVKRVEAAGGYVAESNLYESSLSMVVKIPAAKFDTFVESTGDLGKILSRQISVEDVTQQFYDLENRIKNKRILVQRLQSYLSGAGKIEDLLKIERELSDATTELESLEASFKNLSHLISYSTLSIGFRLPDYESGALNLPSLRSGFRGLAESVVKFLYVLLFIVIGIIVFGVPAVLVLGALYLVTFGKVGLVKRYFGALGARIGRTKKPKPGTDG